MSEPLSNEKNRLRLWQAPVLLLTSPIVGLGILLCFMWQSFLVGWAFGQFTYEQFIESLPERKS